MRVSQWMFRGGLVALVPLAGACNAILGVNDVTPEPTTAGSLHDAQRCDVMSDFTLVAATPSTSLLTHHRTGGGTSLLFLLNNDGKPDSFAMDLYDNMGGHAVVNTKGRYDLMASDATLAGCGICVRVYADFDSGAGTFSQTYFAAAQGTLDLTTFDTTGISGSLTGLKLRQVDLSGGGTQIIPGGCTVTIDDAEFTAEWSTTVAPAPAVLHTIQAIAPSRAGL